MFYVYVENHIDFSGSTYQPDAFWAVIWAIAVMLGPCRSGGAEFIKVSEPLFTTENIEEAFLIPSSERR